MNQKSRQKATSPVKCDFCKFLNNSNFGIDCRNNIENRVFEPIYCEISKIAYIEKLDNIFDNGKYTQFSDVNIMTQEVNEKYDQLIINLDKTDPTYIARKYSYESQKEKDLDSLKLMAKNGKRQGKKRRFHEIDQKKDNTAKSRTTKMIVDFCVEEAGSIKPFAIKEKEKVQVTTRLSLGQMLMFAKLCL